MSMRTSSCTHCSSPCREHSFDILGNRNDPVLISEDIERLDRAIHRLRILKSQRCRQLNTIRSSTRILPNEILLSIFHLFCSFFESKHLPPFILGGVCSDWRNLINNEPLFWRNIDLSVEDRSISKTASLFEVFKTRNGASFEHVQFDFENLRDQTTLCQQLSPSIRKVSTLSRITLRNPPVDLLRIINKYLSPHNMSLSGPPDSYHGDVPEFVPSFSLPWSVLTNLKLSRIRVDICCKLLLGCPNLIEFSSKDSLDSASGSILPNTQHARETHFPHLQHLTWHHQYPEWDDNFLSFYHFPALRHFCWHGHQHMYSADSLQLFRNFITSLPQSCHTFQLAGPKDDTADLDYLILEQITLPIQRLICSDFFMITLADALEDLQRPTFIPSLTFFKWECGRISEMSHADSNEILPCFKVAIQGRKEIGVGRFTMEIEGMWMGQGFSKENSYEVMGGGFDFEITEDGCWIISF